MPDEFAVKRWFIKWGSLLVVAILGGMAREAKDRMDGQEFGWWEFCARLVIAAFAGLLTILVATNFDLSQQWIGAMAGIAGYSGVEAIECVKRVVRGRFGL